MKNPNVSSELDDFTQKFQSLSRQLFRKEKGETFGEESDEEDVVRVSTPTVVTATRNSCSSISESVVKSSVHSDTKSENAKSKPTTRHHIGKNEIIHI